MRILLRTTLALSIAAALLLAAGGTGTRTVAADPWADEVIDFVQGPNAFPGLDDPTGALGPPDVVMDPVSFNLISGLLVSLGEGGHLTLRFDEPIQDLKGPDFAIYGDLMNNDFILVEVSADGTDFVPVPGVFPEHLAVIDIAEVGLAAVSYVRMTDDDAGDANGAEIDAVGPTPFVNIVPDPPVANLWLCNVPDAPGCANTGSGVEESIIRIILDRAITSPDPKCTEPNPADCPQQTLGSGEAEYRYDAKFVTLEFGTGELWDRPEVRCDATFAEGIVQTRCVTKGKPADAPSGPGVLGNVHVRPTADVYSILIPNQGNGITTQIILQDCQLSDLQGHPIPIGACNDVAITIRYLEGDVHADCVVDALDQQQIAFRYGARLGNLLYNERFDLEPSAPKKGDGDIDAKDLQFVYGRHGSTCKDPHPPQPPVDPKAK